MDTRNGHTTQALLRLTSLCAVAAHGFEPRGTTFIGTLGDVDALLSDELLLDIMRASAPILSTRRMGTSTTVQAEFVSPRPPKYAYIGLLRREILLFVDRLLQCRYGRRFGHVSAV